MPFPKGASASRVLRSDFTLNLCPILSLPWKTQAK